MQLFYGYFSQSNVGILHNQPNLLPIKKRMSGTNEQADAAATAVRAKRPERERRRKERSVLFQSMTVGTPCVSGP